MDLQVEVQFTLAHPMEELRAEFVQRGHFPDWRLDASCENAQPCFLETRTVAVDLATPEDRQAWFIFSLEACGELRRRIVIPHVVPSRIDIQFPELGAFLAFCRTCLVRQAEPAEAWGGASLAGS